MEIENQLIPDTTANLPSGNWLVIALYADDATFGMGGSILKAKQDNKKIDLIVLTDGGLADEGKASLPLIREQEAKHAAMFLGIDTVQFLRQPVRKLRTDTGLISELVKLIQLHQPNSVFFPSPMELRSDHRITAQLVWNAIKLSAVDCVAYAYEINIQGQANHLVDISGVISSKKQGIATFQNQTNQIDHSKIPLALNKARTFSLPNHVTYAEGFYAYRDSIKNDFAQNMIQQLHAYWNISAQEITTLPRVSVLIRTKDRPELLRQALQSIVTQSYQRIEIVLVNDAGQDVYDLIKPYWNLVEKFNYINLVENKGRSAAANIALDNATGDYLIFLDDDDLFDHDHISNLVNVVTCEEKNNNLVAVYSGIRIVDRNNQQKHVLNAPFNQQLLKTNNTIPIHALLFARAFVEAGCRFDESLNLYEDWDFWLQLAEHTDFYHVDTVSATYRILGDSAVNPLYGDEAIKQQAKARLLNKWKIKWSGEELAEIFLALRKAETDHIQNLENVINTHEQNIATLKKDNFHEKELSKVHIRNLNQQLVIQTEGLGNARQELKLSQTHIKNLDQLSNNRDQHILNLEQKIALLTSEIENSRKIHKEEISVFENNFEILKQHLDAARLQIDAARLQNTALINSTSWRITKPIRFIKRKSYLLEEFSRHRSHVMTLNIMSGIEQNLDGSWLSISTDPQFLLETDQKQLPTGWAWFSGEMNADLSAHPVLYFSNGEANFSDENSITLHRDHHGLINRLIRLPDQVTGLRLDPMDTKGKFGLGEIRIVELGKIQLVQRLLWPVVKNGLNNPKTLSNKLKKVYQGYKTEGLLSIKQSLLNSQDTNDYQHWILRNDNLSDDDKNAIRVRATEFAINPTISIIMPVYNPSEKWLRTAIESVIGQLYSHWELCIVDDASTKVGVKEIIQEYANKDKRIKPKYRESNGHISIASNDALALAEGEFITFLDHDDKLPLHALYHVVEAINNKPNVDIIYSDEDKINEFEVRYDPYFKPDWNPILLLGQNYFNHLTVYRSEKVRQAGGLRPGYEGSQDYDLALRIVEQTTDNKIYHIPKILYHWRALKGSTALKVSEKNYTVNAAQKALQDRFYRTKQSTTLIPLPNGRWRVQYLLPKEKPLVSLIIPTRNGYEVLHRCIESLYEKTSYGNFELIIVDNQSDDPKVLTYFHTLQEQNNVKIIKYDAAFNYSAINNYAVQYARGEILGLLNNDLEIIHEDWLDEMVAYSLLPNIGAVGAKLYYPDNRIQHAGVILGIGGVAGHAYAKQPKNSPGQMDRANLAQNMTAVTAACLILKKSIFDEVNGFNDENLTVAFNDIDLCLRIREKGYNNVWTPFAELYHHESATRGHEDTPEKQARFLKESEYMKKRWHDLLEADPVFNPNLSLKNGNFEWTMDIRE